MYISEIVKIKWISQAAHFSPSLETLDTAQHIQMAGRVLLNHIFHIIRPQRLLEFLLGHMEFHDPINGDRKFIWIRIENTALHKKKERGRCNI